MNFTTKLIVSLITIASTIVGSIWAGFETLDGRMDKKVVEGEKRVMSLISTLKDERNLMIQSLDGKMVAEVGGLKSQLTSMDNKLNILIGLNRRREVHSWNFKDNSETTYTHQNNTRFSKDSPKWEILKEQSINQM